MLREELLILVCNIDKLFIFTFTVKFSNIRILLHPQPVLRGILKELCGIRDNTSSCDIANNNGIVALINDICTAD